MIQIYLTIKTIEEELTSLLKQKKIIDFRIYLKANNYISIYIIGEESLVTLLRKKLQNTRIEIEAFSTDGSDDYLKDLYFSNDNKVNTFDSDRKLVNLLNFYEKSAVKSFSKVPIATFYSYKGGVGRSTTLASCASYLSIHYRKTVLIIDCDFEAPGFTNFFLNDPGEPFYNNGVIEYLLDKEFLDQEINVRSYVWEASKAYSGEGEIFIMPSGNLNNNIFENFNDRDHYLKGLSRIDFSEKTYITDQFRQLIRELIDELSPDVILLDSRTGFNDIFGITAFQLSDLVIGFFGNNVQSLPGIHFFIDSLLQRDYLTGLMVNSVIPASNKRRWFKGFKEQVEAYISQKSSSLAINSGINTDDINIEMFPITRHEILESLGTNEEDVLDFVDFIQSKTFPDHVDLFEKINSLLEDFKRPLKEEKIYDNSNNVEIEHETDPIDGVPIPLAKRLSESREEEENAKSVARNEISTYDTKMNVLTKLQERMPELYAEDIRDFEKEYNEGRYFYRNCMSDLFNLDKIIVLGNKGTGKTYMYRSLKNGNIVNELKKRANKLNIDYQFIHLILKGRYFIDTTKFDGIESFSPEKFYERFWQVYIWNVLCTEIKEYLSFNPQVDVFPISDNTQTAVKFKEIITDDLKMIKVENDLEIIDTALKHKGDRHIIIIFDELDHVVKPHMWPDRIAPLINLCKKFVFSRIYPKMFLRSDLFEKIANVNNIQALNNRSINIEWTREELFAYFFKLILSNSKEDFYKLMRIYGDYPTNHIAKIRREIDKHDKQPAADEYLLKHLTATFFGKYADINNTPRFGESYDWFFKNLKNANDTISLRPFIDLLAEAVKWAINEDRAEKPILPQYYYTHGRARGKAVERHFNDLAKEKGNGDLIYIFQYIRDDADSRFKVLELPQKEFYDLLDRIIIKYKENLQCKTKEEMIELLKVNGILIDRFHRTGSRNNVQKRYQFALLYKYYLGLKNRIR
ncbi:KGGVGR-motif variant AAA ATPase [Olivibacter oleidegradans]|uniref:KGGVGR-motif variant AAA ATPase n=1 Tax=Olivibacter oleidegradans TaxID=760123 RepID=A0ABV6HMV6_9SPHI